MIYLIKRFSISTVSKSPFNFNKSLTSDISDIKRPPSLINLPFKYVVWFEDIREGSAVFRRSAETYETNFVSMLRREIGLQFLIFVLFFN